MGMSTDLTANCPDLSPRPTTFQPCDLRQSTDHLEASDFSLETGKFLLRKQWFSLLDACADRVRDLKEYRGPGCLPRNPVSSFRVRPRDQQVSLSPSPGESNVQLYVRTIVQTPLSKDWSLNTITTGELLRDGSAFQAPP